MIVGLTLAAALANKPCPLERAHYVLRGDAAVTAEFRRRAPTPDWPMTVSFAIRSSKTKTVNQFLPYSGNGQGISSHLASVLDPIDPPSPDGGPRPLGDLDYLVADVAYHFDQGFDPKVGAHAPAHLFIPRLQEALWYEGPEAGREGVPMAFFDLAGCLIR